MSLFEDSDATSETSSVSTLESTEELNLVDIKNWLEYHYGTYRRPRKAIKVENQEQKQNRNLIEIEFDISSGPDYEPPSHLVSLLNLEYGKLSFEKLEEINYKVIEAEDILEEEEHKPYSIHRCAEQDKLLVALGIRYALTGELPVNWIPSLLVDIILEAAAYSAFSRARPISFGTC